MHRPDILNVFSWYQHTGTEQYNSKNAELYDQAAQHLTRRILFGQEIINYAGEQPGKILEIASGTGLISTALHQNYPNTTTFTDLSSDALKILRHRLGNGATTTEANFLDLPFDNDAFDTIIGVGAYRYVLPENRETFWKEMHRVTKPYGRVIIGQFYPRFFKLQGNSIADDVSTSKIPFFELQRAEQYKARIELGKISVTSGVYRSYIFQNQAED